LGAPQTREAGVFRMPELYRVRSMARLDIDNQYHFQPV
jgi:hypothetical protein